MGVTFEHPSWLLLILFALPVAWLGVRWFSSMSRLRRWTAVAVRVVLVSLISAMLAGASSVRQNDKLAVVGVIDVSGSVRLFGRPGVGVDGKLLDAVSAAKEFLARAHRAMGPDDLAGLVAFDGRALAIATPTRADLESRTVDVHSAEGSDIGAAIRYAAALIPPDTAGRLVLFTDGDQTAGDAIAAAREVAGRGGGSGGSLPIDVVPIELDAAHEVMVEMVDAPPRAAPGSTVTVRVSLLATAEVSGTLELIHNEEQLDINGLEPGKGRRLTLDAGRHVELIAVPLPEAVNLHRLRAVFEPDEETVADGSRRFIGDTRAENNRADGLTVTAGQGSVLLVDAGSGPGGPGSGGILAQTLRDVGIRVEVMSPAALPDSVLLLNDFDLVILDNVPAEDVSGPAQKALASHVRDMGAGLVMIGGENSLGAGGWKGTELEPILPVKLDLPEKLVQPDAAVIFVMDNSGSMGRPVMGSIFSQEEIANQSAALAVRTLSKKDLVGVTVFNMEYDRLVPLSPNTDPKGTEERILAISPGGGTNMGPALEDAGNQMKGVKATVKHIIVLSDGRSLGFETLPEMAGRIHEQTGAMISTIAVGDEADGESMKNIAERGGGKYYFANNPNLLPKVFLKAIRVVRTPLIREGEFQPVLHPVASPLSAGLSDPPPLLGLVLTQRRPEATITYAMSAPTGEPLLAHWNVELGKAAVFTSDANKWAKRWVDWPGYRLMWTQIARTMARVKPESPNEFTVEVVGDALHLRFVALEKGVPIDRLDAAVTLWDPKQKPTQINLSQTGAGVYEATIPATETGTYVAAVKPSRSGVKLPGLVAGASVSSGVEYRRLTTDHDLLEQIARESRGRMLDLNAPQTAKLFDRTGVQPRQARTPLWRPLLLWTLLVLLLDVATRRIAWDRFVSREFGVDLRRAAKEAVQDRGTKAAKVVGRLREAPKRIEPEQVAAVRLSDEDAEKVAAAEAERRRQARLAAVQVTRERQQQEQVEREALEAGDPPATPAPRPKPAPKVEDPDAPKPEGLLAAKRRARERIEGESGDQR